MTHPVDRYSDSDLHRLLMRVDATGFPGDLEALWSVERVRYRETLRRIPPAKTPESRLLDLGHSRPWQPFLQALLGYRHIEMNTIYPESGFATEGLSVRHDAQADTHTSVFDVEHNAFPYPDESFDVVLCLELLEHLAKDPMAMMAEVNRVLKPGGTFVLSTPNAARYSNVVKIILGEQPYGWAAYNGFDGNRHNREYTPGEIDRLLQASGITPREVTTVGNKSRGFQREILKLIARIVLIPLRDCPARWRRDTIITVGQKTGTVVDRRPSWLYFELGERILQVAEARRKAAAASVSHIPEVAAR